MPRARRAPRRRSGRRRGERQRRQRVERVVSSDQRELVGRKQQVAAAREPERIRAARADQAPVALVRAAHRRRRSAVDAAGNAHRERPRIVAVEDLLPAGDEDARLGGRVRVDPGVAVEMIVGDVEHRRGGGPRLAVVSSWKLDSSTTNTSGHARRPRARQATSSTGSPMLPTTATLKPAARRARRSASRRCVLPFEPVIASTRLPRRQRTREQLDVADQLDAARDRRCDRAADFASPGLITIRSASASVSSVKAPVMSGTPGSSAASFAARRIARVSATRDVRAVARRPSRGRQPGHAEAEHDDVAVAQGRLSSQLQRRQARTAPAAW